MCFSRLVDQIRALSASQSGAVATIYAITLPFLLILVTASIEYTNLMRERGKVQNALDAALMAYQLDQSPSSDAKLAKYRNVFKSQLNRFGKGGLADRADLVSVTTANGVTTGKVSLSWGRMFGFMNSFRDMSIGVASQVNPPSDVVVADYIDVHIVLDNSGSMLIAADPAAKPFWALENGQVIRCEFACHDSGTRWDGYYQLTPQMVGKELDYFEFAQLNGIRLRFNIMKDAAKQFITKMDEYNRSGGKMRAAIYKMGPPQTPDLGAFYMPTQFEMQGLTDDIGRLKTAIDNVPEAGSKSTNFNEGEWKLFESRNQQLGMSDPRPVLEEVSRKINPQGFQPPKSKGAGTEANPFKWVLLVTDGMYTSRKAGFKTDYTLFTIGTMYKTCGLFDFNCRGGTVPASAPVRSFEYLPGTVRDEPTMCDAIKDYNVMTITVNYYENYVMPRARIDGHQDFWRNNCNNKGNFDASNDNQLALKFDEAFGRILRVSKGTLRFGR